MLEQRIDEALGGFKEVLCTPPDSSVAEAASKMAEAHVGAILVGTMDQAMGVASARTIMERVVAKGLHPAETSVSAMMSKNPVVVAPTDTMLVAMEAMKTNKVRYVLVKDGEKVVGIISPVDILRSVIGTADEASHRFDHLWEGFPV